MAALPVIGDQQNVRVSTIKLKAVAISQMSISSMFS